MTPKCPKCATELRDDYGMVTCPTCGAIVFVDMEGQAHVADADAGGVETPAENEPIEIASIDIAPEAPGEVLQPMSFEPLDAIAEHAAPPANEPVPESSESPSDLDMNAFLGYQGSEPAAEPSQTDPNDPLGISAYANSEMSSAANGPLVVTVLVSGIDAKDLRDEIRQALQDSRFGWDANELMASVRGGVLRIEQISPVKAMIVINRLKNLAVQITWEQHAITELEPKPRDDSP